MATIRNVRLCEKSIFRCNTGKVEGITNISILLSNKKPIIISIRQIIIGFFT